MLSPSHTFDSLVIGAGISGLAAARIMQDGGLSVMVLDKSRGLGGRMATRKYGNAWFDHGAQFITAHGDRFQKELKDWQKAGHLTRWFTHGDNHPRYRGSPSMTAGPKFIASGLNLKLSSPVSRVAFNQGVWQVQCEEIYSAKHLVLAFPVPQSLALLRSSQISLDDSDQEFLSSIRYDKCLAGLFTLKQSSNLPSPGLLRYEDAEPIQLISDNQVKGISADPTLTLHAGSVFSDTYFDRRDQALRILTDLIVDRLGTPIQSAAIHGWKYSKRRHENTRSFYSIDNMNLWFCGDSFGPSRIEGAFLSGEKTATRLTQTLNKKTS